MKILILTALAALPLLAGDGQAVFNRSCKMCHGEKGQGNPAVAKVMNVTMPNLGSKEIQARTDDEIKKDIMAGKGKMRPVKTVSEGEIHDVISFVRSLAKK